MCINNPENTGNPALLPFSPLWYFERELFTANQITLFWLLGAKIHSLSFAENTKGTLFNAIDENFFLVLPGCAKNSASCIVRWSP